MTQEYALYKGEEFLDVGTAEELADKFNVQPKTIKFYSMPSYIKRVRGAKKSKIAVRMDCDKVTRGQSNLPWTNDHDIYLDKNYSTTCNAELADYLDRTESAVRARANLLCLEKERSMFSVYKGDELLGVGTAEELAEKLGVRKQSIQYYATPSYKKIAIPNGYRYAVRV